MKTFAREKVLNVTVYVVITAAVFFAYGFLWPVVLFMSFGFIPSKIKIK